VIASNLKPVEVLLGEAPAGQGRRHRLDPFGEGHKWLLNGRLGGLVRSF
jgi:hypothetical protein